MDQRAIFDKLPDDKCATLIRHIFSYCADENPATDDLVVEMAFEGIKQSLKRDLKKWRKQHRQRVTAGRKGGLARAELAKQSQAELSGAKQSQANQAVSGSGSVSDSVSDSVSVSTDVDEYTDNDFLKALDFCRIAIKDEVYLNSQGNVPPKYIEHNLKVKNSKSLYSNHANSQGKGMRKVSEHKSHCTNWLRKKWIHLSQQERLKYA